MATITLNKPQINYFTSRVADIENVKLREIDEGKYLPAIQELTREEKLGQIRLGKAVLKESVTADNCTYNHLLKAFEFEGDDVIEAKKNQRAERAAMIIDDIKKYAQELKDRFVLREFETTEDVETALKDFREMDFAAKYLQ